MDVWHNATTGKDNKTHDVVRIAIALVTVMLPLILLWGMVLETWAITRTPQVAFDMNAFFMGIGTFLTLFGAFLASGSVGILLKKTTEPDNSQTTGEVPK